MGFRVLDPAQVSAAATALRELAEPVTLPTGQSLPDIEVTTAPDGTVSATLSEAGLRAKATAAVEQSIEIIRRRVDETGVAEALIAFSIGLALNARRRYFMRNIPEAALLLHLRRDTASQYVEPLPPDNWNREGFLEWIEKEKPDCIVVYEDEPIRWLESAPKSLRTKIGTAYLSASKPDQTGLVADVSTMIRECIGMIHWMIQTGERGIPARCRSHGFRNLLQKGKSG
jgi:hypothetical protein